jgi:hypothetical protein
MSQRNLFWTLNQEKAARGLGTDSDFIKTTEMDKIQHWSLNASTFCWQDTYLLNHSSQIDSDRKRTASSHTSQRESEISKCSKQ